MYNKLEALDHLTAMLTVCDILSATRNRIPGYDTDFYSVLHLMPSSSSADVKWKYEELVILLQPIKGKFSGTELALKLIEEAFSLLSDRSKRLVFDAKRGTSWSDYESTSVCKQNTSDINFEGNTGEDIDWPIDDLDSPELRNSVMKSNPF